MRIKPPCFLAYSIFFVLIAALELDSYPSQNTTWSEAEWKWLGENFHSALDHMLPLEKGSNILVSYRSYETLQVGAPEYSFSISERPRDGNTRLSVHVRIPDGQPIGHQLLRFHREHPMSSINVAEKTLNFKDWVLNEQQCPSLRNAVQKLEQLRFGMPSDKIYLDPTLHEFHLSSSTGTVDALLVEVENPLVQWGIETRREIQVCGAGSLPTVKSAGTRQ
jgi:hypothetical protein